MAERGRTWSEREISVLLTKWAEAGIQRQLVRAVRNVHPFREIADELRRQGFERDYKQCREKIKALKKKYKETVDRLRRSGVGVEDDDDLEDVDVQFRWFAEIHGVMGGRAAVVPPEVLDTSDRASNEEEQGAGGQNEVQPGPSGLQSEEQQGSSGQREEQQGTSEQGEVQQSTSGQGEEQEVPTPSVQSEGQQGPSAQSGEQPGPSRAGSREQSGTAGPRSKKRKVTKLDRMEKSNKELADVLLQAQEESRKGFLELEKKRMDWQAEQARREHDKDARFMAFVMDVFTMFAPPPPMPYYPPTMQPPYTIPPVIPVPPNPEDEEEQEEESAEDQDS